MHRQVILGSRPNGIPQAEHFTIVEAEDPKVGEGQFLVRAEYWSVDPAMKGWTNLAANYAEPVAIGEVMRASSVGTVVESTHADYPVGTRVVGSFGWTQLAVDDGRRVTRTITADDIAPSLYLGPLGLTGVTAWYGFHDVCSPKPGDTVVVSTAAGSVGSIVGQLAKRMGCRTVGITGGPVKVAMCLEEFGYDAAVDYRSPTFADDFAKACPEGVDVYYDNTAGSISDTVHRLINRRARIAICGTASVESWDPVPLGPRVERLLLTKTARIQGFNAGQYRDQWNDAIGELEALVRNGELHVREEILEGVEAAPDAIAGLYRGENLGKRVIHVG